MDTDKLPKDDLGRQKTPEGLQPDASRPDPRKPLPDGEAIAEVGDALGGPA